MGYKTPEELSLLKITDKYQEEKIETILKEIKDNFGWTLETGYQAPYSFTKKATTLEYKKPSKSNEVFKNFVKQSIDFLDIAEAAEAAEKAEKARANQVQQGDQPEKTLKGSLGVKKAKLDELDKQK